MNRRRLSLLVTIALTLIQMASLYSAEFPFYIGTYTKDPLQGGIWRSELNPESGALSPAALASPANNPSFLVLSPDRKTVFATEQTEAGAVLSFRQLANGKLAPLSQQPSGGSSPCHLSLDKTGETLFVANYSSGTIASLPITRDGLLEKPPETFALSKAASEANSKNPSNAHGNYLDSKNRFLYACDLGSDTVGIFQFDPIKKLLAPHPPHFSLPLGSGPRHLAFHPTKNYLYVNAEKSLNLFVFERHPTNGSLTLLQTIASLPPGTETKGVSTAEILCHPSGKWVYLSNRAHDSITQFSVSENGKLTWVENIPSPVKIPWGLTFDPSGRWVVVAGQGENKLTSMRIDSATGKLTPSGEFCAVESPLCVVFLEK